MKSITLFTQIHQFSDNQQTLLRLTRFSWKSPKNLLDLPKGTQNFLSHLVQCYAKSGKAMPDSGVQEWPSNIATNIEEGGRWRKSHYFCD